MIDRDRCKDCSDPPMENARRCARCRRLHADREALRRAERRARERCTVCGMQAADDRTMCETHLEYYARRAEVVRVSAANQKEG